MDFGELAERCEKATGYDWALDRDIWVAVVADDNQRELIRVGRSLHGDDEAAFRIDRMMDGENYTASLDAAMTLVPEGAEVAMQSFGGPGPMALVKPNERFVSGKTLPLALCAAALRARTKQETPAKNNA